MAPAALSSNMGDLSKKPRLLLALALLACGGPTEQGDLDENGGELAEHEVRATGRITSDSQLIAHPIKLVIPIPGGLPGEGILLDSVISGATDGKYALRAVLDSTLCNGDFLISVWDAFGRWVGKRVRGCGRHDNDFELGPGIIVTPND